MPLLRSRSLLKLTLLAICIAGLTLAGMGQHPKDFIKPLPNTLHHPPTAIRNGFLPVGPATTGTNRSLAACENTAFRLRLTATPGQQVSLTDLKTLVDGSYIASVQIRLPDGRLEAGLLRLDNNGAIVSQRILTVDNENCTIDGLWLTPDGLVYASGFTRSIPGKAFLMQLGTTLTTNWVRTMETSNQPLRTFVTVGEDRNVFWASQSASIVHYGLFTPTGVLRWVYTANPANTTDLMGVSAQTTTDFTIGFVGEEGGLPKARYLQVNGSNGTIVGEFAGGAAGEQTRTGKITYFNNRLLRLEIHRSTAGTFTLKRHIQYYAQENDVTHTYAIPGLNSFLATAVLDNAGDAMGICLTTTGRLFFLKQFGDRQTRLEFAREYSVPIGSTLIGTTRSYDGGFLLGLNTEAANEILLLKTDSTGQIPTTCNAIVATIPSTEQSQTINPTRPGSSQSFILQAQSGNTAFIPTNMTAVQDCFTNTCLPAPPEDSCLSSYYRVFRTNSYGDFSYRHSLMRGQRHLLNTARYDRTLTGSNIATSTLKLMDDRGSMIKAVNLTDGTRAVDFTMHKLDDRQVMIVSNNSLSNESLIGLTLVDDNLNMIWSRTLSSQYDFYSLGAGISDIHQDEEGNFYLAGTKMGFMETPKCTIVKLDANGNLLWNRTYEWPDGLFGMVAIASTPTSIVAIIETSNNNKTTLRLRKSDGSLQNSFRFKPAVSNAFSSPILKFPFGYSNGNLYYAGQTESSQFLMGKLDSTGRPLLFKTIAHEGSMTRAGAIFDGHIYASYKYYNGQRFEEVLLKADSSLNFRFARQVSHPYFGYNEDLQVADNGSIFVLGNQWYDSQYFDPYLMKFDPDGRLGTCTTQDLPLPVQDLPLSPITLQPTLVNRTVTLTANTMSLVADSKGLSYAQLLCSSASNCSTLDIQSPGPVCLLDTDISVPFRTNPGCTLRPTWTYDTAFAQLVRVSDSNAIFRFRRAGSVTLRASLDAGCRTYEDSVTVGVSDAAARPQLGADTLFCPGDSIRLRAGQGFASYLWQDGSVDSVNIVRQPGTYWVSVTNACGDRFRDTILVRRVNVPVLTIGNDSSLCPGSNLTLQASPGFNQYQWTVSGGAAYTGASITLNDLRNQIQVWAEARTTEGCMARDSIDVRIFSAASVNIGPDLSFCSGDSARINAGGGFRSYTWNTGATSSSIMIRTTGSYSVETEDLNGCISRDTMSLEVNPVPVINLGADRNLCAGASLSLDPGPFSQYRWQDGSTNRTFLASQVGTYHVTVTNNRGCTGSDSLQISAILPTPSDFLAPTVSFCKYQDVTLSPNRRFNEYLWSTGARQQTITVDRGGRYTLEVTDLNGCRGRDTIQVIENDCLTGVFIPNAFTPNGDNLNDRFLALVYGRVESFRLEVYNRFGELVYATNDPRDGWDGNVKGKQSPGGNFVWVCRYQLAGESPVSRKGTLTLIR